MSSTDCYSLGSSEAFSTDGTCLPRSRIKCNKNQIIVGDNSFCSASDALLVYLMQYDASVGKPIRNRNPPGQGYGHEPPKLDQYLASNVSAKSFTDINNLDSGNSVNLSGTNEDVESLLLSQMSSSQLQEEVSDTFREIKLRRLLKHAVLKTQNQAKTDLQREVEAALLRSAQLLEKVGKEDTPFTSILTSDINSVSTKTPVNDSVTIHMTGLGKKQPGHVYSYRTSHNQKPLYKHSPSKFLHIPASYSVHQQSRKLRRSASIDNFLPVSHKLPPRGKRSFSSSSVTPSYHSDPTDVLKSVRSRSASPSLRHCALSLSASGLEEQIDQSMKKSVPSWVGELSPTEASDSLWKTKSLLEVRNDERSFDVPSWVGEAENSYLHKDSNHFCESESVISMPCSPGFVTSKDNYNSVMNNELNSNSDVMTDSRPGLKFSDLVLSDWYCPEDSKQTTSLIISRKMNSLSEKFKPRHPMVNQTNLTVTNTDTLTHQQRSKMLDSEYIGENFLHKNILPQTAKLKKSMNKFVASSENLKHRSLLSELSLASGSSQCSSLDTMSLLTGKPLQRVETLAASSATKNNILAQDGSVSPTNNGQDQYSSDGLDGDRPWEKMAATFKSPVPVDNDTADMSSQDKNVEKTLSGRKQPGSMETLKNMLFKLQAEESSTQEGSNKIEETSYPSNKSYNQACVDILPALQNYDFVKEPGGQSLEKALVHLNRLKKLVESTATPTTNNEAMKAAFTTEHLNRSLEREGS